MHAHIWWVPIYARTWRPKSRPAIEAQSPVQQPVRSNNGSSPFVCPVCFVDVLVRWMSDSKLFLFHFLSFHFFFFSITSWFCGIVYPPLLLAARPPTVRAHITLLCLSCALLFLYYSPFLSLIILSIWMKQLFFFPSCLIFIININIWRFFFSTECVYTHSGGSLSAIGGSFQENGLCTMHNRGQNAHNRR